MLTLSFPCPHQLRTLAAVPGLKGLSHKRTFTETRRLRQKRVNRQRRNLWRKKKDEKELGRFLNDNQKSLKMYQTKIVISIVMIIGIKVMIIMVKIILTMMRIMVAMMMMMMIMR